MSPAERRQQQAAGRAEAGRGVGQGWGPAFWREWSLLIDAIPPPRPHQGEITGHVSILKGNRGAVPRETNWFHF